MSSPCPFSSSHLGTCSHALTLTIGEWSCTATRLPEVAGSSGLPTLSPRVEGHQRNVKIPAPEFSPIIYSGDPALAGIVFCLVLVVLQALDF